MPMTDEFNQGGGLEAAFDAARSSQPAPSADLMARVLADAQAVQAEQRMAPSARAPRGVLQQFLEAMGGWPAVAGLSAAGVAGVWLGLGPMAGVSDTVASYLGVSVTPTYSVDVMPGAELGLAWEEGAL